MILFQLYDAVLLDGTFYQKSGIISGGSSDVARKVTRWTTCTLTIRKEKLSGEMTDTM